MRAALLAVIIATVLRAQPDRFGLPACQGPGPELAVRSAFILCHGSGTNTPVWTAYELTPERMGAASPRRSHFRRDPALSHGGATDADYRNSSYARGHMVPARDLSWSEDASRDSFLLSNAVPQNPAMNRSVWRRLENEVRRRAQSADSVIVFTGPVFCPDSPRIGHGRVAVPCELFKVAVELCAGRTRVLAVVVPNADGPRGPLDSYATTIEDVRHRTGLDLLPLLESPPQ